MILLVGCTRYHADRLDPSEENWVLKERTNKALVHENQTDYCDRFPIATTVNFESPLSIAEANLVALYYSPIILKAKNDYGIAEGILIDAGAIPNPESFIGPRISTKNGRLILPASLAFYLYLSDRRTPQKAAAKIGRERAEWLYLEKEIQVMTHIQKVYLQLDTTDKLIDVAGRAIERMTELLDWARSQYERGKIDLLTYQLAMRGLENGKDERLDLELRKKKMTRELFAHIGLLPNGNIQIKTEPIPLLACKKSPDRDSFLSNPSLKAIELEYCIAEETLKEAIAAQYPALRIGPEMESDQSDLSLGLGLGVEVPLFTRNRTAIALAEENRDRIRNQYQGQLIELFQIQSDFEDEIEGLTQRLEELQRESVPEALRAEEGFSQLFKTNGEGILIALSASEAMTRSLRQQIEMKSRIDELRIELLVILGQLVPESKLPSNIRKR